MKQEVISYYENTRQYYRSYHDHKEVSAWAGLVLYMVFIGVVNWIKIPNKNEILIMTLVSIFVIVISILVYRYISTQIKMKDLAGAYAATSFVFLSEIIQNEQIGNNELIDYLKISESADTNAQSNHVLPKIFLNKSVILNTRGRGFQDRTRSMIYGILISVTIFILIIKWWNILV